MSNYSPIALFCYNRLDTLKLTVKNLKNNFNSSDSFLYIFSDGPKSEEDNELIFELRTYLYTIIGFKKIYIIESKLNMGLKKSIIDGVNFVLNIHDKVIVIEDDLITSKNFLLFMNQALQYYANNDKVFNISGYSPIINYNFKNDVYFTKRSSSWGWAIWKHKWQKINWDITNYRTFTKKFQNRREFNKMGSDMSSELNHYFSNRINSWCIVFTFNQYILDLYSVHPTISKVKNIGISHHMATNTKSNYFRFRTQIDITNKIFFDFTDELFLNKKIIKQFIRDNSYRIRFINKASIIFNYFFKKIIFEK